MPSRRPARALIAACLTAVALAAVALDPPRPAAPPAPAVAAPWTIVANPLPVLVLDPVPPPLAGLVQAHEARRHRASGAREDTLTIGALAEPSAPFLRLVATRGPLPSPTASFFVELARRAADAGLAVERAAAALPFPTKFGDGEAADARLGDEEAPRACLAFRVSEDGFALAGWLCGEPGRPADRGGLACLLDALAIEHAGAEPGLRARLARVEGRRGEACPALARGSAARRVGWLDAPFRPESLKGR